MPRKVDPDNGTVPSAASAYLAWAIATHFRHLRPGRWLPLLVEFKRSALPSDDPTDERHNALHLFTDLNWLERELRPAVRVPQLFSDPPKILASARDFNFCVLLIDRNHVLEVISQSGWQRTVANATLGPPLELASSVSNPFGEIDRSIRRRVHADAAVLGADSDAPSATLDSIEDESSVEECARVLIAVLDEGIAFAQQRFCAANSTRIVNFWRQDGIPGAPGVELAAVDIDAARNLRTANGRIEEDLLYRDTGAVDFSQDVYKALARRRAHGTHVLDLAATIDTTTIGNRPIIAVELPEASVADPAGVPLEPYVLAGIAYVLKKAEEIKDGKKHLPIVLNLSYGPHHGPHDGTSAFERALDSLIVESRTSRTPLTVVLAAGNFRQSRVHARRNLRAGKSTKFHWRVQPQDLSPSLLDLWLAANVPITVKVTSPRGDSVELASGDLPAIFNGPKGEVFRAAYTPPTSPGTKPHFSVMLQPTATDPPLDPLQPTAPSGLWEVELTNKNADDVRIDGWIWRGDTIGGRRPHGRQSYFDEPDYCRREINGCPAEFDPSPNPSCVSRRRTMSGFATGEQSYVIGGYRRLCGPGLGVPAPYSSMGPTSGGARTRNSPDALAPSDDSLVCSGVLAAGTRSGSTVAMNGTSVAAPQMARWLANRIASRAGTPSPIPAPPLQAPPTAPPPPFVPPAYETDVAGDGLLPLPWTRIPRKRCL